MDYPTAIVAGSAIITAGLTTVKIILVKKRTVNNGSLTRKDLYDVLDKKLSNVVYLDTCLAFRKSYEKQLALISNHLSEKIDNLSLTVNDGLKDVKRELENHRGT
jgi:hypothetical protein